MAQHRDVRSEALHAVRAGRARSRTCSARSRRSTRPSTTSSSRRGSSASRRVMDRGALIRIVHGARTSASSCTRGTSTTGTPATSRRSRGVPHIGAVIAQTLGPEEPGHAGRSSPSARPSRAAARRDAEGVPHRRLPRHRVRPVPDRRSAGRRVGRAAAEGARRARASRAAAQLFEQLLAQEPVYQYGSDYQRESLLRSLDAADRLLSSPSAKAFDLSLEPKEVVRHLQHRPLRPGLPAGAAAGRGGRALHRGHDRVHPVPLLGHARERPRARRGHEEADRRARSRS